MATTPLSGPRLVAPPLAAPPEIRRAAEELEAVFLAELLAPVFEALDTEGLGGGGAGERMFRPMLVQEYAKSIAATGGVGLADAVARELLRLQAAQTQPTPPGEADGPNR